MTRVILTRHIIQGVEHGIVFDIGVNEGLSLSTNLCTGKVPLFFTVAFLWDCEDDTSDYVTSLIEPGNNYVRDNVTYPSRRTGEHSHISVRLNLATKTSPPRFTPTFIVCLIGSHLTLTKLFEHFDDSICLLLTFVCIRFRLQTINGFDKSIFVIIADFRPVIKHSLSDLLHRVNDFEHLLYSLQT